MRRCGSASTRRAGSNRRGFGRFARNAVGRLVELDAETEYVLLHRRAERSTATDAARGERTAGGPAARSAPTRPPPPDSNRRLQDLLRLARAARSDSARCLPLSLGATPIFRCSGVPTLVGVHDTIVEDHPDLTFPSRRARVLWPAQARGRDPHGRGPLHCLAGVARRDRATDFGIPARAVADRAGGAGSGVLSPRTGDEIVAAACSPLGLSAERPLLPLRRRDQPAQERRDADRRVRGRDRRP